MSKIEECWVIQRDDGEFLDYSYEDDTFNFSTNLCKAFGHYVCCENTRKSVKNFLNNNKYILRNCKPVKIEIRVVGE